MGGVGLAESGRSLGRADSRTQDAARCSAGAAAEGPTVAPAAQCSAVRQSAGGQCPHS